MREALLIANYLHGTQSTKCPHFRYYEIIRILTHSGKIIFTTQMLPLQFTETLFKREKLEQFWPDQEPVLTLPMRLH